MVARYSVWVVAAVLMAVAAVRAPYAGELYRWVDEKGSVHYTDDPASIPREGVRDKKTLKESDLPQVRSFGLAVPVYEGGSSAAPVPEKGFEKGMTPPDFSLSALDGASYSLSRHRGKVVFLNFWATWCLPCRSEMPSMQKLYERMARSEFTMMAVSQEKTAQVRSFVGESGYTFPVLIDDGSVSREYGVSAIPRTFIIDRRGAIVLDKTGGIDWADPKFVAWFRDLAKR